MSMKKYLLLFIASFLIVACSQRFDHPDVSAYKDINVSIDPFYKAVFCEQADSIPAHVNSLSERYGDLFLNYVRNEMHLGNPSDMLFNQKFQEFVGYVDNNELISACDSAWNAHSKSWNEQLTDAFQCLKALIPGAPVPDVYAHVSGFNSKMFMDSTYISFSIEHYLGSDCRFYQWLDVPLYARATKNADNVTPDIIRAWLYGLYPNLSDKNDILSDIVYQGRILYCVWRIIPSLSMAELLGYDKRQISWCESYEAKMWGYMAENNLLYSTKPMDKAKMINEAPFVSYFGQNSPGRAPLYCGLKIAISFMERFPKTTLEELLTYKDAQKILMGAAYNPK